MSGRLGTGIVVILAVVASLGCSTPVYTRSHDALEGRSVRKIALAPFSVGIPLAETPLVDTSAEAVAALVTARVFEALTLWTEFEVIPPAEVDRYLMVGGPLAAPSTPAAIGARLAEGFGVDAVLYGTVYRFVQRVGGRQGASRPAAAWFELELRSPEGALLWSGSFDEIQQSLADEPGSLGRAWKRGFGWLSGEELVQYGAEELARRMPRP